MFLQNSGRIMYGWFFFLFCTNLLFFTMHGLLLPFSCNLLYFTLWGVCSCQFVTTFMPISGNLLSLTVCVGVFLPICAWTFRALTDKSCVLFVETYLPPPLSVGRSGCISRVSYIPQVQARHGCPARDPPLPEIHGAPHP